MGLPGHGTETTDGGVPTATGRVFTFSLLLNSAVRAANPASATRTFTVLLLLSLAVCTGGSVVFGQADIATATVKGIVTDETGAGVNGATITLTNSERGVVRIVQTDN